MGQVVHPSHSTQHSSPFAYRHWQSVSWFSFFDKWCHVLKNTLPFLFANSETIPRSLSWTFASQFSESFLLLPRLSDSHPGTPWSHGTAWGGLLLRPLRRQTARRLGLLGLRRKRGRPAAERPRPDLRAAARQRAMVTPCCLCFSIRDQTAKYSKMQTHPSFFGSMRYLA